MGFYSKISEVKGTIEYINSFYEGNFKNMIIDEIYISKTKSICWSDWMEKMIKIGTIQNEINDKMWLYNQLVKKLEEYSENIEEANKLFNENITEFSISIYEKINCLFNLVSFSFESDGFVGIDNDWIPCCILNISENYEKIIENIDDIIKERIVNQNNSNKSNDIDKNLLWCFTKIQSNRTFFTAVLKRNNQSHDIEDARNRQIRDLLEAKGYDITDQTQTGISPTGINPGEVDLLIKKDKFPDAYLEGMNQNGFDYKKIVEHINKIFTYDCLGVASDFIFVYYDGNDFTDYSNKYFELINDSQYFSTYELKSVTKIETQYAEIKKYCSIFNRDGTEIRIIHFIVKIPMYESKQNNK